MLLQTRRCRRETDGATDDDPGGADHQTAMETVAETAAVRVVDRELEEGALGGTYCELFPIAPTCSCDYQFH